MRPSYSNYEAYSALNLDIFIVTMKESGQFMNGYNINMDTAAVSMIVGGNTLFVKDSQYIFAGHSWGYKTHYQNVTYDLVTPTYDSFVFKYDPFEDNECFYQDEVSGSSLRSSITT
mmetsp:Transcript_12357/g.19196  ORF Transcript_12357/g.19196 Transcript_12357/m.19196 type:complete len:116 (+) Transcript_12357:1133-1480(+)